MSESMIFLMASFMLNFGFIGLGQVGGIFSDDAKRLGYASLAINTASVDLNTLSTLSEDEKIHLYGYEGAGKDRSIGNEAFLTHQQRNCGKALKDIWQEHTMLNKSKKYTFMQTAVNGCRMV